jgi:hypothetical protein
MKFFVLYRVPVDVMNKWKAETSPEEMQKQNADLGAQMGAWIEKNKSSIVDMGNPLGKNTRMTKDGAHAETNDLNFYHIIEAENVEAVVAMFQDNPHLTVIPNSFLDIMEMPKMTI